MRKLAWFSCAFALAALCCVYVLPPLPIWIGVVVAAAAFALHCLHRRALRCWVTVLLGFGIGLSWTTAYYSAYLAPAAALHGRNMTITGEVTSYPVPSGFGYKIDMDLPWEGTCFNTLVYLEDGAQTLQPGDTVTVPAQLEMAGCRYSPEERLYYRARGYVLVAYGQGAWSTVKAAQTPPQYWPAWACRQVQQQIETTFPPDTVPFMKALLTGDRSGFDYATKNEFSLAGVSHVIAISGMHLSILLAVLLLLLPNRRLAAVVGIPLIIFFTTMTGASASTLRAAVMQILLLLAPQLNREVDLPTSLSAAMLVIVAANPWAVADLSFQLSFAATAGLLLVTPRLLHRMEQWKTRIKLPKPLQKWTAAAGLSVAATLGAMVFTTPLIACNFGVVSMVSVAANFLTLWAVTLCFQVGMLVCLLGFALPTAAGFLASLLAWLVRYFLAVTHTFAALPFAAVYTNSGYTVLFLVCSYVLLGCFILQRKNRSYIAGLCCLLAVLGVCTGLSVWESRRAKLQTTVLDVGQGQCVLLEWDGLTAMVDCGGSYPEEAGELASRLMLSHGRTHLDALILTHFDADHAGGIPQLLQRIEVGTLYMPKAEPGHMLYKNICDAARKTGTALETVTQDTVLTCGDTVLQIFAPVSYEAGNDGGLAVLSSNEEYDIVITGDMSLEAEHRLLTLHQLPDTEILVVGHHGAATSTGEALLQAAAPDVIVFSVGSGNRYGHPAPETLERAACTGAAIYRTDIHETITIRR